MHILSRKYIFGERDCETSNPWQLCDTDWKFCHSLTWLGKPCYTKQLSLWQTFQSAPNTLKECLHFQMDLWFAVSPSTDKNFDRLTMLKAALFDIFADHNRIPAVLDYVEMVGGIWNTCICWSMTKPTKWPVHPVKTDHTGQKPLSAWRRFRSFATHKVLRSFC